MEQEEYYGKITAFHYSAYRPDLHNRILQKCLNSDKKYILGLDVGCGTGHSSLALTTYCEKVIGIDPSQDMIDNAIAHPKIEYKLFDGVNLDFPDNTFDIVTFGGSLFYAKSQALYNELVRITTKHGKVVVYDFEVELDHVYGLLGLNKPQQETEYLHKTDFSGLLGDHLIKETQEIQKDTLRISSTNLAHLMLSVPESYEEIVGRGRNLEPFTSLIHQIESTFSEEDYNIPVFLYWTKYGRV